MNFKKELEASIEAGKKARLVALKYYNEGYHVEIKNDNSPVTEADKECDKIIREYLSNLFPTYSFLTEESKDDLNRLNNDYCFIVDPIDGTEDFIHKDDEFTINIALCYKNEIVVGVVVSPVKNEIYYALKGEGAYKILSSGEVIKIKVNDKLDDLKVLKSRYHSKPKEFEIYNKYKDRIKHIVTAGSSLKACLIAEGKAELSYRVSDGTKEWDTAAFTIIVEEAGGHVLKYDGTRIKYNKKDVYNHDGYVVMNNLKNFIF